jgi:hypothetical protein
MHFIRPHTDLVPLYLDSVGKSLVHHFAHAMLLKVINSHYLNVIHLLKLGRALWSVLVVLLALCLLLVTYRCVLLLFQPVQVVVSVALSKEVG